jgi:hypothetical protein
MTFEVIHVSIRVLNLCEHMLISKKVFCHSCHPVIFFLVQVIVFYKKNEIL